MLPDVILFGIQGSGKGTQGKMLASEYGYTVFDTGSALRAIAAEESELGVKVKTIIERGDLVPTEVVMEVIADFIDKQNGDQPIVFDGIPRNKEQQEQFDALMEKVGKAPTPVLIDISRDVAEKRLLMRKVCSKCKKIFPGDYASSECNEDDCDKTLETRKDDNPEAINKRLDIFVQETMPVIESYKASGKLITIDGLPSIPEVSELVKQQLPLS